MAAYGFILMLMVGNSLALWNPYSLARNWAPSRARAFECTEQGTFCSSCTEACFCTGAGAPPIPLACSATQVCIETGPIQAACGEYAGASAGDCDCESIGNSGFLVDPFDSSKYMLCVPPESQYFLSCTDGQVFSTTDNACVEAPTTTPATTTPAPTTTGPTTTADAGSPGGVDQVDSSADTDFCAENGIGLHTDDPTCQTYTACYSDALPGLLLSCNAGEVFDSSALTCVPECDLAPAAFSCAPTDSGALPDTVDCTIFHVCSNGLLVTPASGISCPDGQVFEPTSMTCVADSPDAVCPEVDSCWAAYCESCGGTSCPATDSSGGSGSSGSSGSSNGPSVSTSESVGDTTVEVTTAEVTTAEVTTAEVTTAEVTTPAITTPVITTDEVTTAEATTTPAETTAADVTTAEATTASATPDCGNAAGVYEDTTDCSQFYQCETSDNGSTYEAILFSCPDPLVFVPSLGYCFLQSSLPTAPGCIAS